MKKNELLKNSDFLEIPDGQCIKFYLSDLGIKKLLSIMKNNKDYQRTKPLWYSNKGNFENYDGWCEIHTELGQYFDKTDNTYRISLDFANNFLKEFMDMSELIVKLPVIVESGMQQYLRIKNITMDQFKQHCAWLAYNDGD